MEWKSKMRAYEMPPKELHTQHLTIAHFFARIASCSFVLALKYP